MGRIKSFRDLLIWKKGKELVKRVYTLTNDFPRSELFGLSSQMRRCAISIPCNVAEGFRRGHTKEFRQFLNIARGSCAELETQLLIAQQLEYVRSGIVSETLELVDHASRMITNLLKKV